METDTSEARRGLSQRLDGHPKTRNVEDYQVESFKWTSDIVESRSPSVPSI